MDYRLKKEKDFNIVFNKGKRLYSSDLTLLYLPSEELKVGYAVGKKHGGSVKRNKVKEKSKITTRKWKQTYLKNIV